MRQHVRGSRACVRPLPLLRRHGADREPVVAGAGRVRAPLRPPRRLLTDFLFDFAWRLGHWAYLLLFLGAALESAAFLGFLVPGETIVILAGVLTSFGVLELPEAMTIAVAGAIIGDNVGYHLGRHLGRPWLEQHGHRVGMQRSMLERIDTLFARHGGKAVLIGRFVGFLRAMAPFAAGASHMSYRVFVPYNAVGATAWGIFFVLLGYVLGESWTIAERWLGRVGLVVGTIALIATIVWLTRMKRGT